jgi:hypothetical protein
VASRRITCAFLTIRDSAGILLNSSRRYRKL